MALRAGQLKAYQFKITVKLLKVELGTPERCRLTPETRFHPVEADWAGSGIVVDFTRVRPRHPVVTKRA